MTRRQIKITRHQLETITSRFIAFLKGDTPIMADEAFQNAVQSYHDVFLKSERVIKMVESGATSQHDFREVFRNNIEKRVRYVMGLFSNITQKYQNLKKEKNILRKSGYNSIESILIKINILFMVDLGHCQKLMVLAKKLC